MLSILKRFRKQDPIISDAVLAKWVLENIYNDQTPSPYRTRKEILWWMVQRIKNTKNAIKWVYNTMKMQELQINHLNRISNPEEFMKQFEDELCGKNGYVLTYTSSSTPFANCLDGVIHSRIYGIVALMSICGKNRGAMIEYLSGLPARP